MLKISAVYLIGKAEIPIHYTTWADVEQALLAQENNLVRLFGDMTNASTGLNKRQFKFRVFFYSFKGWFS